MLRRAQMRAQNALQARSVLLVVGILVWFWAFGVPFLGLDLLRITGTGSEYRRALEVSHDDVSAQNVEDAMHQRLARISEKMSKQTTPSEDEKPRESKDELPAEHPSSPEVPGRQGDPQVAEHNDDEAVAITGGGRLRGDITAGKRVLHGVPSSGGEEAENSNKGENEGINDENSSENEAGHDIGGVNVEGSAFPSGGLGDGSKGSGSDGGSTDPTLISQRGEKAPVTKVGEEGAPEGEERKEEGAGGGDAVGLRENGGGVGQGLSSLSHSQASPSGIAAEGGGEQGGRGHGGEASKKVTSQGGDGAGGQRGAMEGGQGQEHRASRLGSSAEAKEVAGKALTGDAQAFAEALERGEEDLDDYSRQTGKEDEPEEAVALSASLAATGEEVPGAEPSLAVTTGWGALVKEEDVQTWSKEQELFASWRRRRRFFPRFRSLPYFPFGKESGKYPARGGLPRVMLVTARPPSPCQRKGGDYALYRTLKNKVDYARTHGMQVLDVDAVVHPDLDSWWQKVALMPRLMLHHPDVDWFFWVDADAVITDLSFEIPWERYEGFTMVVYGRKAPVYREKAWDGLNGGIWLLRNSQESLSLLRDWAAFGVKGETRKRWGERFSEGLKSRPRDFPADDQSALVWLMNQKPRKFRKLVFLEHSYSLHGDWRPIAGSALHRLDDLWKAGASSGHKSSIEVSTVGEWPFVTHFVGCKPCGGAVDEETLGECDVAMEKALNFADNQLMSRYGLVHPRLEDPALVPVVTPGGSTRARKSHGAAEASPPVSSAPSSRSPRPQLASKRVRGKHGLRSRHAGLLRVAQSSAAGEGTAKGLGAEAEAAAGGAASDSGEGASSGTEELQTGEGGRGGSDAGIKHEASSEEAASSGVGELLGGVVDSEHSKAKEPKALGGGPSEGAVEGSQSEAEGDALLLQGSQSETEVGALEGSQREAGGGSGESTEKERIGTPEAEQVVGTSKSEQREEPEHGRNEEPLEEEDEPAPAEGLTAKQPQGGSGVEGVGGKQPQDDGSARRGAQDEALGKREEGEGMGTETEEGNEEGELKASTAHVDTRKQTEAGTGKGGSEEAGKGKQREATTSTELEEEALETDKHKATTDEQRGGEGEEMAAVEQVSEKRSTGEHKEVGTGKGEQAQDEEAAEKEHPEEEPLAAQRSARSSGVSIEHAEEESQGTLQSVRRSSVDLEGPEGAAAGAEARRVAEEEVEREGVPGVIQGTGGRAHEQLVVEQSAAGASTGRGRRRKRRTKEGRRSSLQSGQSTNGEEGDVAGKAGGGSLKASPVSIQDGEGEGRAASTYTSRVRRGKKRLRRRSTDSR